MAINKEDVQKLAKLSRLRVTEEEIADYSETLGSILGYVEKLQEVKTEGVHEMQHAAGQVNVYRDDEVEGCEKAVRDCLIDAFPQKDGDLLAVQAVFDERTE